MVWKLDRLGRSMRHLVILVEELRERGVNFRSLTDAIDTSTPMGRFFFHVMGARADSGRALLSWQAATALSQFGGNYPEGSGHAIADYDGISAHQPGFSRFQYTSNSVGDGVNFIAVRPRNIAFNFLVRAK